MMLKKIGAALEWTELADPQPGRNEIRVKVAKHDNTGQRASDLAGEKPSFHQDESR
jgi:D-arabinose 1-dehydrogenase-like Zn-dependent alcohol dehydrogenase